MDSRFLIVLLPLALIPAPSAAQLALPGAAAPPAAAAKPAAKPKKSAHAAKPAITRAAAAPDIADLAGRPLMQNGSSGLLQLSGSGQTVRIDRLKLTGEGVADSSQKCEVDIVGETPIEAVSVGRPAGLERYEASVPACPFAFDVLNGAVVVPAQITACVFKAADCQTSPGGVWGPDAADLDAAQIAKRRMAAEKALGKALRDLQARAEDNPDAANLLNDQNAFPGQRDDECRAYVKESSIGFCGAVLTEGRAAFLETKLAELPPALAKPNKKAGKSAKRKPKPKPKAEPPATADAPKP